MERAFTHDWLQWIELNLQRGCDKDGIFRVLLDEGFSHQQIVTQMRYEPSADPGTIENPLSVSNQVGRDAKAEAFFQKVRLYRDKIYLPNARPLDTQLAELYVLDDFLDSEECARLMALIASQLHDSYIAATNEEDESFRTSSTCDMGRLDDPFVKEIDARICRMLGVDSSYGEVIQGQHYSVGQEFKAHTDYFEADQYDKYATAMGQRTYTFFIYLNNVEEGGETEFESLDLVVRPRQGSAIVWNNLDANGIPNPNTIHRAHPVRRGEKYVITKWFRALGSAPMYSKEPNEYIHGYTRQGFCKTRLDPVLFEKLVAFYRENRNDAVVETIEGDYVRTNEVDSAASTVVELPASLKAAIHVSLLHEMNAWSGTLLEPTHVYGIRDYQRGAVLEMHRDRLETHIISAIINVAQDIHSPWPLCVEDHYYRLHQVYLEPGEVVFYEGGRLRHGRPYALDGASFANIFCHYRPA
ncbi:2OG-Fe(II) oxygenase [Candidatus Marimicrobium litorale]|uniref:Proline hydroxylase n=1 Tax=Candidatus Marimicrobium litorale TaxID=2518991 RepID=A0ABT3T3X0_9GAMM|nr:2OG-Fe(II) oxygenase [Candidatus Marimicrobium litorale]MCX2976976.1 proline hydroxylase [Candidatus Marimicrobium litorale]